MRGLLIRLFFLVLLLACAAGAGWWNREALRELYRRYTAPAAEARPAPDPGTYSVLTADLSSHRARLGRDYRNARSEAERKAVLAQARKLLEAALPHLMECWLGTPWDFNGMAEKPGHGKIACGYFVSTILRDAGFEVERVELAQQASQNILRTFLPEEDLVIRVGMRYERYLAEIERAGPGVFLVGLDSHVAFLVVGEAGIRFIHSSGQRPWCVVDESRREAVTLQRSRYRVSGNLTANPGVLEGWLLGAPFKTFGSS